MERGFIKKFDGGSLIFNRGVEIILKNGEWGLDEKAVKIKKKKVKEGGGNVTLSETMKLKKEIFIFVKNIALTKNKFAVSIFHEFPQLHLEN